jgi:hypothetical protein
MSEMSKEWREMDETAKEQYGKQNADDKIRFEKET